MMLSSSCYLFISGLLDALPPPTEQECGSEELAECRWKKQTKKTLIISNNRSIRAVSFKKRSLTICIFPNASKKI